MARGIRFKKYSRRTSRARNSSRVWLAVLIVAVFLVLCLLISVVIGLVLGKKAESQAQKPKLDVAVDTYYSGERQVKRVDAIIYDWDFNISNIWRDEIDFSVCLQESDGSLAYDPGLGITLDGIAFGEKSLAEHVGYIKDYGGHVSAYLYVRTFDTDDEYLRNIICDFEIALVNISEFLCSRCERVLFQRIFYLADIALFCCVILVVVKFSEHIKICPCLKFSHRISERKLVKCIILKSRHKRA